MYEILMKELASYELGMMNHGAEMKKGGDVEYNETSFLENKHKWQAVISVSEKILGVKESRKCEFEAKKLAELEFAKGSIYID